MDKINGELMGTVHKTAMESDHGEFDLRLVHNFQMFASLKNEVGCSKLCVCVTVSIRHIGKQFDKYRCSS